MKEFPKFFEDILSREYGEDLKEIIKNGYERKDLVTLRANTLKTDIEEVKNELKKENLNFKEVSWNKDSLILKNISEETIRELDIYKMR